MTNRREPIAAAGALLRPAGQAPQPVQRAGDPEHDGQQNNDDVEADREPQDRALAQPSQGEFLTTALACHGSPVSARPRRPIPWLIGGGGRTVRESQSRTVVRRLAASLTQVSII